MAKIVDIRKEKTLLRQKYRKIRNDFSVEQKKLYDRLIADKLLSFADFLKSETILCYVSTDIEIDTLIIIEKALEMGKRVAVPTCVDKRGSMDFYFINSLSELKKGFFGLLEPNIKTAERLSDYKNSICILPGFAFDTEGYRIGFGKGFYDRFLSEYFEIKIGLCYNECLVYSLPHGKYDISSDYIITPKYIFKVNRRTKNG